MRSMSLAFTTQEWESVVINELIRVVKPGGWIEIMERDPWWTGAGTATNKINRVVVEELQTNHNINAHISPYLQRYMSETHKLSEICHLEKKIAVGAWGGNLGNVCLENYRWFFKNIRGSIESIKDKEFNAMLSESLKEFTNSKAYETGHRFFAMKIKENVGTEIS
ncbi:4234_t:CDS:2 [Acaulospora morrowiae]|uniref:4234_t:CDS:1 n=1 Tax=Acaulospora morrowiae TaxID=94023 RepID=A0A9N9DHC6_9GLOM|nr:4234_t:CDS:2 [Acaulospora morrowiae]